MADKPMDHGHCLYSRWRWCVCMSLHIVLAPCEDMV